MGINEIRLRNFRGFKDASLPLKPLTVLLGPNSAGKSAFGHALASMAHAHKVYASTPQASLTPPPGQSDHWPTDLGGTSDLRTRGAEGPVRVGLLTSGGWVELGFGGLPHTDELILSEVVFPSEEQSTPTAVPTQASVAPTRVPANDVVPLDRIVPGIDAAIRLRKVNEVQWKDGEHDASVYFSGLIVGAVTHATGSARVVSTVATKDLKAFLDSITYLRANRKRPSRRYSIRESRWQHMGYSGECTAAVLSARGSERVSFQVPPAIPATVEEARVIKDPWSLKQDTLGGALSTWLTHCKLASNVEAAVLEASKDEVGLRVRLDADATHDITEVGFGVSQITPVLVAGLLQQPGGVFIVDLPEAHLHPRPQANIADFFCSLALSGTSVLVETHSEMFFHRLRLRAAMSPALLDHIAVYFLDEPKDGVCSVPRRVGLRVEDEIRWPRGFMQEAWETEAQISAVREGGRTPPA
jgi:predicted ATPase